MTRIVGDDGRNVLEGGDGDDLILGKGGDDWLDGHAGADTLMGGDGDDTLNGVWNQDSAPVADRLDGGAGDDRLTGDGGDTLLGGGGADTVTAVGGPGGRLDGGDGFDQLIFSVRSNGNIAYDGDLGFLARGGSGKLDGVTISGFEQGSIELGGNDDTVTLAKSVTHWTIQGGGGDDNLAGQSHADVLGGGSGDDTVTGGGGDDQLYGDSLYPHPAAAGRADQAAAGSNPSVPEDLLRGEGGDDHLYGDLSSASSTLLGGGGDDVLSGGGLLRGGTGDDTLTGGGGGSAVLGDNLSDTLIGGAGEDVYRFERATLEKGQVDNYAVIDTTIGRIDLSDIDAKRGTAEDDAFRLVDHFDGHGGEVTIAYNKSEGQTHVNAYIDNDDQADVVILIMGKHLDPGEYVL